MSGALSDIDDTGLVDVFGYGGMRYRCQPYVKTTLRKSYRVWNMPNYLRYRVKGGCYFFTVNLLERKNTLLINHIDLLRESVWMCKQKRPFHIDAWVVLPEHMHSTAWMQEVEQSREQLPSIWTLPEQDDDFSNRWKVIKTNNQKVCLKMKDDQR